MQRKELPVRLLAIAVALVVAAALTHLASPLFASDDARDPQRRAATQDAVLGEVGRAPVAVDVRHDFLEGSATRTFTIPEHAQPATLRVHIETGERGACVGAMALRVVQPDGTPYHEMESRGTTVGDSDTCGSALTRGILFLPEGDWRVEFSGDGLGYGVVSIHS